MLNRRKRVLVSPRVQITAALILVGMVGVGMLLLTLLAQGSLTDTAENHPRVTRAFLSEIQGELLNDLVLALLVLSPLAFATGVLMTFRLVGPIYRFETYLLQLLRDEELGPCRIRAQDELHDFCDLLNEAVEKLRASGREEAARESAGELPSLAEHQDRRRASA